MTLILAAVPSREGIEHYTELKNQLDQAVGKVNGRHGTLGWVPVWYLYRKLPFRTLLALYTMADVALITPLRDGMNLIAKEYVATKRDGKGVLILSEFAGASKEMSEALLVNVNSPDEIVEAIREALEMPEKEQVTRNRKIQERLRRYNVNRWASDFLEKLSVIKNLQAEFKVKEITPAIASQIHDHYRKAKRRLLLLDYDGTLVPFALKPRRAKPDYGVVKILRALTGDPKNTVVIISGRDREILDRWFGRYRIGLVAEHGVWMKAKGGDWGMMTGLSDKWKPEARAIMELAVDRIEGSLIEEKDYSLAWHYRKADPRISERHIREIVNDLLNLTANSNLRVLEGSKVVEVKSANLNKGSAAQQWLSRQYWDFVLAIGDDVTDEDLFQALPEKAWSIKVRPGISTARFSLDSPDEVRALLGELVVK